MDKLTIEQYKFALKNLLNDNQLRTLLLLYKCPNASATSKQLAALIRQHNPYEILANGAIGRAGKRIANHFGIIPPNYFDGIKERPAYFMLISDWYKPNIGWTLYQNLQYAIEQVFPEEIDKGSVIDTYPTEALTLDEPEFFKEGKLIQVFVNRYERNRDARKACLNKFGNKCQACGFDFDAFYGPEAKGFIEVHHLISIAEMGKEYEINPCTELVPLCSNCHSFIHISDKQLSIDELRALINQRRNL